MLAFRLSKCFATLRLSRKPKLLLSHIAPKMPSIKRNRIEDVHEDGDANIIGGHASARSRLLEPLIYSGSLDSFQHQDLTPVIGREFEGLQVTDLLRWGDAMIKDLAITGTVSISNLTKSVADKTSSITTRRRISEEPRCHTNSDERPDVAHN